MTATDTKAIAFVLYPGLTPLDLIGPLQALSPLSRIDPTFEVVVVGETTDVLPTDSVIKLAPSHTFDDGGLYLAARLVGEDAAKLIQRGMEYEPRPPFGPIVWDPDVIDALRPIWRGPLAEELARHPHLAREARLGRRPTGR